jgi:[protein-PII] uridylyltransferase
LISDIKNIFQARRDELFFAHSKQADSLTFSKEYSLLIEEFIRSIAGDTKYNFAIASAGSFSRREFSPYSDVDIIFIADSVEENAKDITELVTRFWDNGLEVSHTVRDLADIQKYILSDLHTFTQFFETRYLLGSEKIYKTWNEELINALKEDVKADLIKRLIEDSAERYDKYGSSPKMLEPNVKYSAGGLRDLQLVEWMYIFSTKELLNKQQETTQIESFLNLMKENKLTSPDEASRALSSYKLILSVRNLMHLGSKQKKDRFEFSEQIRIAKIFGFEEDALTDFMRVYFNSAVILNRFSKSMIKKFYDDYFSSLPSSLSIVLDDDFEMKGRVISMRGNTQLTMSDILRAFYYRGVHSARFDEALSSYIVDKFETTDRYQIQGSESSVFFREILKLPKNVGQTLYVMNELGALGAFMPEFKELNGFLQHGVYHSYTTDEHTLIAIQNVEKLENENSQLGKIFNQLKDKEKLFLGLLLHDIAKPINISGHEIIGAELASSIMYRMGYSEEEINTVSFLVHHHLIMEQTAFRRNLNDPETLNNFTSRFNSIEDLDQLYLLTYADLSAVNSVVWTSWKSELLAELYRKTRAMLEEKISGEDLLYSTTYAVPKEISKHSPNITEEAAQDHIDSFDDLSYTHHFGAEEIVRHIEEIDKGSAVSVIFSESNGYSGITLITKDFPSLLSRLCGVMAINDINIHDAKIFTRKDGIVIDSFNVTDFSSHKKLEKERFTKIEEDMNLAVRSLLQLGKEVALLKSKWWRIESKLFKKKGNVKVAFENHERFTIIDVHSPDRLGFLYHVTSKMNELGLNISFAKISTQADEIVDAFYVLDRNGKKISPNDYEFVKNEITSAIDKLL